MCESIDQQRPICVNCTMCDTITEYAGEQIHAIFADGGEWLRGSDQHVSREVSQGAILVGVDHADKA